MRIDYEEGKKYLQHLYRELDEKYSEIENQDERYFNIWKNNRRIMKGYGSRKNLECLNINERLMITYPGKKSFRPQKWFQNREGKWVMAGQKNPHIGDYILFIDGQEAPKTHDKLCSELYNLCDVLLAQNQYERLENVLRMLILTNQIGTKVDISTCFDKEILKNLNEEIFWTVLQEEINYPNKYDAGKQLAFCRYIEAVFAAIIKYEVNSASEPLLSLDMVMDRCNNKNQQRPRLIVKLNTLYTEKKPTVYSEILKIYSYHRKKVCIDINEYAKEGFKVI